MAENNTRFAANACITIALMSNWYILPNGNIRHANGLEIQPEEDWFPTPASMEAFTQAMRKQGMSEVLIIKHMMTLALECEKWAQDNLT